MSEKKASALVIGSSLCWGIIGIFTRNLHDLGVSSLGMTFWRSVITAAAMIIVCLVKDKSLLIIKEPKDIFYFIGTGICSIVFFNFCYFTSMQYLSLSAACVLLYTAPAMVVIMSAFIFKESVGARKVAALIISFLGCVFMTGVLTGGQVTGKGILLGLGSGLGYALYTVIGAAALKKYRAFTLITYTFIISAIALIPVGIKGGVPTGQTGVFIILMGLVSTLLPYILYTKGLEFLEAGKASIMAFFEPVMATVIGVVVFKEYLTFTNLLGIILIFVSIVLLNTKDKKAANQSVG